MIEFVEAIAENASNPFVRGMAGIIGAMATSMGYQKIVEKAKIISARMEQKEEDGVKFAAEKSINRKIKSLFYALKSDMYAGITEYRHTVVDRGDTFVELDLRDDTLTNNHISIVRAKYNTAIKDVRDRCIIEIEKEVREIIEKGDNKAHRRGEAVASAASTIRRYFFDEVHKISGLNKEIKEMESQTANIEYFIEMIENVLTHIEERSIISENDIAEIHSKYKVNTLNFKKIYNTIFHHRR